MDARRGATAEVGGGVEYIHHMYPHVLLVVGIYYLTSMKTHSTTCKYSCTSRTTTYEYIIDISLIESYERVCTRKYLKVFILVYSITTKVVVLYYMAKVLLSESLSYPIRSFNGVRSLSLSPNRRIVRSSDGREDARSNLKIIADARIMLVPIQKSVDAYSCSPSSPANHDAI